MKNNDPFFIVTLVNGGMNCFQIKDGSLSRKEIFGEVSCLVGQDHRDIERYLTNVFFLNQSEKELYRIFFIFCSSEPLDVVCFVAGLLIEHGVFGGATPVNVSAYRSEAEAGNNIDMPILAVNAFLAIAGFSGSPTHSGSHATLEIKKTSLEADIERLQREKKLLEGVFSTVDVSRAEFLASFLNAIFEDFWKKVSPEEFAQITGLQKPPVVNAGVQMNANSVALCKRNFRSLPDSDRQVIIGWADLFIRSGSISVRPAFREVVGYEK